MNFRNIIKREGIYSAEVEVEYDKHHGSRKVTYEMVITKNGFMMSENETGGAIIDIYRDEVKCVRSGIPSAGAVWHVVPIYRYRRPSKPSTTWNDPGSFLDKVVCNEERYRKEANGNPWCYQADYIRMLDAEWSEM